MFAIITREMLKLSPNASVVKIPASAEALLPLHVKDAAQATLL